MGSLLGMAAIGLTIIAVAGIVAEWAISSRRKRNQAEMDAQWRDTEDAIRSTLSDSERQLLVEDVRLRALSNQSQLNQLCQATATALRAPAAVITLVEHEGQRWLAVYGAEWCGMQVGQMQSLDASYCKYVVATDAPLVITDSLKDIRVRTVKSASLREVRAYLGAPVHAMDGTPMGSLCVFDVAPRKWTERDRVVVSSFASLVAL